MKLEKTLLDKLVNGGLMNKRKIGRPLKHVIKQKGTQGWLELLFAPRNQFEKYVGWSIRRMLPYLSFFTYRFHVEKARESGIRIEDFYFNKFHKEPYIYNHIYAQYFHPETLLERVRDVHFYRRPRTLFKGFKVPDWATAEKRHGWEVDHYSRAAWHNAQDDMRSEMTPMQFVGERLEPNPLNWFRLEQFGKGTSSRLFYNEVPNPTWIRHKGHLDNPEKYVYSFTHGDQHQPFVFGIDTTTDEGKKEFIKEYEAIAEMVPELVKKEDMVLPHEWDKPLPDEAHFKRIWMHYRLFVLNSAVEELLEKGDITESEANAHYSFFSKSADFSSFSLFIHGKTGKFAELEKDPNYQAACKVHEKLGLDQIKLSQKTSQSYQDQWWDQFDVIHQLSEEEMEKSLPYFVTDPSNQEQVQALINERKDALDQEKSKSFGTLGF